MESLGEILTANSAASYMLGRLQNELVGSNISVIIPEPYHSVHNEFMVRYANTGTKQ